MADENVTPEEEREVRIHDQEADGQDTSDWDPRDVGEDTTDDDGEGPYVEPVPELGKLHQDYVVPGVASDDMDPYKWHTGRKRDHGGEDAIEAIDVVKQFGKMRIQNGL